MRNDKIIPGVVLILIGAAFLLHNYGVVHFHWGNFFHLWPILFVVGGINLIFANRHSAWATTLKLTVIIVGFGLIVFGNFGHRNAFSGLTFYDDDDYDNGHDKTGIVKSHGNNDFAVPFAANAKVANLNISGGGAIYYLSDTTSQLFTANTRSFESSYMLTNYNQDSVYVLNFKTRGHHGFNFDFDDHDKRKDNDSSHTNAATFKLNPNPEWNITVKTGATELNFDLSKFKVRTFELAGGAAAFNVKLGEPLATTNVNVKTGMSDVNLSVPADAACHIKASTGLSSTNFDGFNKIGNDTYETPGFGNAKNKMFIKISGGMADFKVKRY